MKYFSIVIFLVIIVGAAFMAERFYQKNCQPSVTHGMAVVYPTKGNTASGVVEFWQQDDGVRITATIEGLTPGKHGFHVHEFGNCACDDAICAGGHYNPTGAQHGGPDDTNRHVGDFGNLVANEQGIAKYDHVDTYVKLNGPYSVIGRAVIIHADPDDLVSQPTGNAGARVGCGVIGIAKA